MSLPPLTSLAPFVLGAFLKSPPRPAPPATFAAAMRAVLQPNDLPKRPAMQNPTIALVVSILTLAAQLGRALGPDAAAGFFDDLFAGRIGPEAAAEKAAAALSTALDVGILAAQLSALHGLILAADAEATVNKAVDFSQPPDGYMLLSKQEHESFLQLIDEATKPKPVPLAPPPGYVLIGEAQYAEYLSLLNAAAPAGAPVPLISAETDAGFARLEQEAQASEEGAADRG